MEKISLLKGLILVSKFDKLTPQEKQSTKKERLQQLVGYAKVNSPYYAKLYKEVGEDYQLIDLPTTNKVEMMNCFNEWLTDRTTTLEEVQNFTGDLDNIGRQFKGKYLVFTTSGSTGNPSIVLYDKTALNIMSSISVLRAFATKEMAKTFIKKGKKTAGVYATGGFYLSNSTVRRELLKLPIKKKTMMVTSILKPISEIAEELNKFQPVMLGGYPTALELLLEEQKKGTLHIAPSIIMAGGEYFSKELRECLKETFKCYVQTNYSCTEGGIMTCECEAGHLHVNEDWLIIEPVDKENKPVENGVLSDKILLTNLSNYTQPIIRFEITDRIIMHNEPCTCGKTSPWLEIEGRTDEILRFETKQGSVKILPLALYAILKEIHGVERFQLIQHEENRLELRLVIKEGKNEKEVFEEARTNILNYLKANKIEEATVYLSENKPEHHVKSGKFKHIYKA